MRDKQGFDLNKAYSSTIETEKLFDMIDNSPERFGQTVLTLIPCLDGELTDKKDKNTDKMSLRYHDVDNTIFGLAESEIN
jgi:hypothetical protein